MSGQYLDYQEQLRLLEEQNARNRKVLTVGGLLQNPNEGARQATGSFLHQPMDVEQERPPSQAMQQIFQMAQQAAQMADGAASMARNAADMARQVANMAAQELGMPFNPPSMPAHNPAYMAPNPVTIQAQTLQPLDQPMESYQSQFSVAEGSQRKKKKRATTEEAGGPSRPIAAIAPNPNPPPQYPGSHTLSDYQMQLMLLEQQSKSRVANARNANPASRHPGPHAPQDYDRQTKLREQQIAEETAPGPGS